MTLPRFVQHQTLADFAGDRVNLERDDVEEYRSQGNRLRERLERHIEAHPDYALVKMLNSGSLAKATALRTAKEMDIAVYVERTTAPEGQEELVYWLRDRLQEAYVQLDADQFDAQDSCVTLRFRSSQLLDVDVVPVLYEGDSDNFGTLILKNTGQRVYTSISRHIEFVRSRNRQQPQHFRQVVRLLKWWSQEQRKVDGDYALTGFLTELLCAHLADSGETFDDYPTAMAAFFTYLAQTGLQERVAFADNYSAASLPGPTGAAVEVFDPVNAENNVASDIDAASRDRIVEAAVLANEALADAAYATTKGRAVEDWQDVLGSTFNP